VRRRQLLKKTRGGERSLFWWEERERKRFRAWPIETVIKGKKKRKRNERTISCLLFGKQRKRGGGEKDARRRGEKSGCLSMLISSLFLNKSRAGGSWVRVDGKGGPTVPQKKQTLFVSGSPKKKSLRTYFLFLLNGGQGKRGGKSRRVIDKALPAITDDPLRN